MPELPRETKRKFLIPSTLERAKILKAATRYWMITQGYLSFEETEVRVRLQQEFSLPSHSSKALSATQAPATPLILATEATVTSKRGGGVTRSRIDTPIHPESAQRLLGMADPHVFTKVRVDLDDWIVDMVDDLPVTLAAIRLQGPEAAYTFPPALSGEPLAEVTYNPAYSSRSIALEVGRARSHAPGYHLRHITKGVLGEVSKIREELEELEDAVAQQNRILQHVELSDLYGALEHMAQNQGLTMADLASMAHATHRAFSNGRRS